MYATKVEDGVFLLDTYALGQPRTVGAYVIKAPKIALVDCGYASSYKSVLQGLSEVGVSPSEVSYVIPTHVHLDHAGAAGVLLKEMPNAKVVAQERSVKHLVDPTKLVDSATQVFGEAIMRLYGAPAPIAADRITAVGEEATLELGGGASLTMMHTPGHAPHQISILIDRPGALLTADAVGIVYPGLATLIPTTPPPSLDPASLAGSVDRLAQTAPRTLLVPHFGQREDSEAVFARTKEGVQAWVREVERMRNLKMDLDAISDQMERKVMYDARTEDLPVYAKVSVRSSVMGILHYLEKNS